MERNEERKDEIQGMLDKSSTKWRTTHHSNSNWNKRKLDYKYVAVISKKTSKIHLASRKIQS